MKNIPEYISAIRPTDETAGEAAIQRWNAVAKPLGSLGCLEEAIVRIAALRGSADFSLKKRTLLVFCADNGVVAQGVSQCGSEVTAKVAVALSEGRSTANTMAKHADCRVLPVDVGIRDFPGHPGVRSMRVRNGTEDISSGPAMSREECLAAMERGAALARELADEGMDLIAVGEMGIGNTTTAAALAAALLNLAPEKTVGRGAGLSTDGLRLKCEAVRGALRMNRVDHGDVIGVLAALGGLDIAAMCGAFLGAAAYRIPAVIDGMISAVAALCAKRLCPDAGNAMLASHISAEPGGRMILDELGLCAPLDAGMHLGEGTGALMLMPLLDMAWEVYQNGQNFERLGIEAYQPLT